MFHLCKVAFAGFLNEDTAYPVSVSEIRKSKHARSVSLQYTQTKKEQEHVEHKSNYPTLGI